MSQAKRAEWYPLTDVQDLLWKEAKKAGFASTHNIACYIELKGPLDLGALRGSLEDVIARHDALRMIFDLEEPRQRPHPKPRLELEIVPARKTVEGLEDLESEARSFVTRPIDLVAGPPLRGALYRLSEKHHLLVMSLSHFVADGWSRGLLTRDLGSFYRLRVAGAALDLPPIAMSFGEHARLENSAAMRREVKTRRERRVEQLESREAAYRPRSAGRVARPHRFVPVTRVMDQDRVDAMRHVAEIQGCTLTTVFYTLVERILAELSDQREFLVAMPVLNQFDAGVTETIGMYANNVLVASRVEAGESWKTRLDRVHREMTTALEHRHVPFRFLERATPGVSVLFNMVPTGHESFEAKGLRGQHIPVPRYRNRFPLSFRLEPVSGGMLIDIGYLEGFVTAAEVDAMLARLDELVPGMTAELSRVPSDATVEGRIEHHLAAHPSIRDSVVFEWPDPVRGRVYVAYVIATTTLNLEDLRAHCTPGLPAEQVPGLLVLTPRAFPDGTGPVRRAAARERFRRILERHRR